MLVFDIETNGLYSAVSTLYCMCIYDTHTGELHRYAPDRVEAGVHQLYDALAAGDTLCGHNIINYDLPVLAKLYPWFRISREQRQQVVDTLVLSRLIYSAIEGLDAGLMKAGKLPPKLFKSHSLRAWGYRLGVLKGTYGEAEDAWDAYTPEMLDYNEQDVKVTWALYQKLTEQDYSERAIELEHQVAWLMSQQEKNGFPFEVAKARELERVLRSRAGVLTAQLVQKVPLYPDRVFVPKRDNKKKGYVAGVPVQKYKDFNPNSRKQIEWLIRSHFGYEPDNPDCYDIKDEEADLKDCRLKIDDESLAYMLSDEKTPAELKELLAILQESLMVRKRLGQLADGANAWLDMVEDDGRIHGAVVPNGAVSGRATHHSPNVAQVPHVGSPYGQECRELFTAGGWWQAGVDASGLELRCLAHYMYPYDDGAYAHTILTGDIHTMNQEAAGLPTRNQAKTFIYAFLYGAGDAKIGKIINSDAKAGKRIKKKFMSAVPALANLRAAVENALVEPASFTYGQRKQKWKRHYLKGLDGRKLHVRSVHSALNLLLQSAGALICKKWIVLTEDNLVRRGLVHGWDGDFCFMAWVHDEIQVACRTEDIAKTVCEVAQESMRQAQAFFNFRVQLDTEGKIGRNWYDCH